MGEKNIGAGSEQNNSPKKTVAAFNPPQRVFSNVEKQAVEAAIIELASLPEITSIIFPYTKTVDLKDLEKTNKNTKKIIEDYYKVAANEFLKNTSNPNMSHFENALSTKQRPEVILGLLLKGNQPNIKDESKKVEYIRYLLKDNLILLAKKLIETIADDTSKEQALGTISKKLETDEQVDWVLKITEKITKDFSKYRALVQISNKLKTDKQIEKALEIADTIKHGFSKYQALVQISNKLKTKEQVAKALEIAKTIKYTPCKGNIFDIINSNSNPNI